MRVNVERINVELARKYWTIPILARASGVTRQTVWRTVTLQTCTFQTLGKIAKALEVNPKDLLLVR